MYYIIYLPILVWLSVLHHIPTNIGLINMYYIIYPPILVWLSCITSYTYVWLSVLHHIPTNIGLIISITSYTYQYWFDYHVLHHIPTNIGLIIMYYIIYLPILVWLSVLHHIPTNIGLIIKSIFAKEGSNIYIWINIIITDINIEWSRRVCTNFWSISKCWSIIDGEHSLLSFWRFYLKWLTTQEWTWKLLETILWLNEGMMNK